MNYALSSCLPLALCLCSRPPPPRAGGTLARRPAPGQRRPRQPITSGDAETLKVNVNLVNLFFSVRDKDGYITNLHKDDCNISEDKVPQTIKNFTQEKNLPLTIGILLDTSGSQQNVLPLEQQSGAEFLKDVLTPKDEAFLISFDINVNLLADYTNSPREIQSRHRQGQNQHRRRHRLRSPATAPPAAPCSTTPSTSPPTTSSATEAGRKILVLLTDGGDQGSQETLKTATEAAQKANAIVYVILIADRGFYGGFGINLLTPAQPTWSARQRHRRPRHQRRQQRQKARSTPSTRFRTSSAPSTSPATPQPTSRLDGTFRTLNVTCGKDQKVQTRKGYYAMADSLGND